MRKTLIALMILLTSAGLALAASQEKAKSPDNAKAEQKSASPVPLRVQLVIAEFDGDKKILSLPYSFSVNADEDRSRPSTQIRNGVKLPVPSGKDQYQYLDVGTNIDCSAQVEGDGRYKLVLRVVHNSVSSDASTTTPPTVRNFQTEVSPILKDGQTFESVMATDPVNGHVYRVTVTLTVPK